MVKKLKRQTGKNPKGIPPQSPGLRASRYPGATSLMNHNPERVAPPPSAANTGRNPVGVVNDYCELPRVAPGAQPWAERRNPVGIEEGAEPPVTNTSPRPIHSDRPA